MQKIQKSISFEIMFDRYHYTNYNYYQTMMLEIGKDAAYESNWNRSQSR